MKKKNLAIMRAIATEPTDQTTKALKPWSVVRGVRVSVPLDLTV
jgi:hypothetical protein